MTLVLKVTGCTSDCCKYLKVSDTTGAYNAISNLGGWGSVNPSPSQVTAASLVLTYPDGVTTDSITATDPRYGAFLLNIQTAVTYPFTLYTFTPVSPLTGFPDGIYHIQYSDTCYVMMVHTTYNTDTYIMSDCEVSCCVDQMFAKLPHKMCDTCTDEAYIKNALEARALLKAYRCNCSCGNAQQANSILMQIQRLCAWADCACGGTSHHHHGPHQPPFIYNPTGNFPPYPFHGGPHNQYEAPIY